MTEEQDKIPVDISNAEIKAKWGLPDNIDPQKVNLDAINPANNDWSVSYTHLTLPTKA